MIIERISTRFIFALLVTVFSIYLVFALNPEGASRILLNLLTFAGIYGLSAIGLNVHFGWTGLLNFGHASFMGVGAYVTILLMPHAAGREGEITSTGLPFIAALIIGILVQVSVGLPFMEGHAEAKNAVALGIMILILLFRPQGIFGKKERIS